MVRVRLVLDLAVDRQTPLTDVDARRVDMRADEEPIDRRDVVREALERHLEIQGRADRTIMSA